MIPSQEAVIPYNRRAPTRACNERRKLPSFWGFGGKVTKPVPNLKDFAASGGLPRLRISHPTHQHVAQRPGNSTGNAFWISGSSDELGLVYLELDPEVTCGRELASEAGCKAIAIAAVRVIAADPKLRFHGFERLLPSRTHLLLEFASRIVQQANVRVSHFAVERRCEAVHPDV